MSVESKNVVKIGVIDALTIDETGDPKIGYPQIAIRTNRTAERTDLDTVIRVANEIADKYPDDKERRAKEIFSELSSMFASGSFGHAWIIIFHSEKKGDYSSYAYHGTYGYVHNNDSGHTNDRNDRGFSFQRIVAVTKDKIAELENTCIPALNKTSEMIGNQMGIPPMSGREGVYTPMTNCSWFVGKIWEAIVSDGLVYTQPFDGKKYAARWGIDILFMVSVIADPGMIAESLAK